MDRKLESTSLEIAAIYALTRWFETEQVSYTTIGGLAVALIAEPRVTKDIDVTVWLGERDWGEFLATGGAFGFTPRFADALEFAQQARVLLLQYQMPGQPERAALLDVSLAAMPFEQQMIERASRITIEALQLVVATPEDLIIMKAIPRRPRDIADIESILNTHPELDRARVRYWVSQFAETLELPELMTELERLLQRVPPTTKSPSGKKPPRKK